jgi:hypothetical protein
MDEKKLDAKTAANWLNWWERINRVLRFEPGGPRVYTTPADTGQFTTKGGPAEMKIESALKFSPELGIVHIRGGSAPAEVLRLAEERAMARKSKDFRKSDELRDKIAALDWDIRDTPTGITLINRGAKPS